MKYFVDSAGAYLGGWDQGGPDSGIAVTYPPEDARHVWDGEKWQAAPATMAEYVAALESHYDAAAQSRRYDNRLTCTLRAGYPGPFQTEGLAFATWMDECNAYAYGQMALVQAGERDQPTPDELVAELPAMVWP